MRDQHEPHDAFVDRLEREIGAEVTRRRRSGSLSRPAPWTRWMPESPITAALSAAGIVIVSMAIGGGVVAASYQAQNNQYRNLLLASYEQRVALASQRVATINDELKAARQRVSVGVAEPDTVFEIQYRVKEADVELKSAESQLAEVRASGREPLNEVSAPLVAGRDFVSERWQIELGVPVALLELETARLRSAERRVAVGVSDPFDVEMSRSRSVEVQSAIDAGRKRLDIRQRFLKKELEAALAELYVLELEAEHRVKSIGPQIDLAKRHLDQISTKFKAGVVSSVALAEAQLRLQERTLEATKAQLNLVTIKQQIALRRGK